MKNFIKIYVELNFCLFGRLFFEIGGLESLTEHIKPVRSKHMSFLGLMEVLVGFLFIVHWSWIAFKYLGEHVGSLNFW